MDRRAFVAGALTLLAAPLVAKAQPVGKLRRIGYLSTNPPGSTPLAQAFLEGLRGLGYVEGQTIAIEYRSADGKPDRLGGLATELVRLRLEVLVGAATPEAQALMHATKTTPIVFGASLDPVEAGLVASLARPGGNVTGPSLAFDDAFSGKWVELLKAAVPKVTRMAVLLIPGYPAHRQLLGRAREAALALSTELQPYEARQPAEFEAAFSKMTSDRVGGLIVFPSTIYANARRRLVDLATRHHLPAIFEHRYFTESGGLLSYGPDLSAVVRRAAHYVDAILKGAKPGDLPIEQPTKFELVINLKTAKALGLAIPASVLARADEIIQ